MSFSTIATFKSLAQGKDHTMKKAGVERRLCKCKTWQRNNALQWCTTEQRNNGVKKCKKARGNNLTVNLESVSPTNLLLVYNAKKKLMDGTHSSNLLGFKF